MCLASQSHLLTSIIPSFNTTLGGVFSLITMWIMAYTTIKLMVILINKSRIDTSMKTSVLDYTNDNQEHYIFQSGLQIGFLMIVRSQDLIDFFGNNSMFLYEGYIETHLENGTVYYNNLDMDECYYNINASLASTTYLNNSIKYYWFKNPKDLYLMSSYYSSNFRGINANIRWNNCSDWPSNLYLSKLTNIDILIQLYVTLPYIDYADISTPIKTTMIDKYLGYVNMRSTTVENLYIQK